MTIKITISKVRPSGHTLKALSLVIQPVSDKAFIRRLQNLIHELIAKESARLEDESRGLGY